MELKTTKCEMCPKVAKDNAQLRKENWLRIRGGSSTGIMVWLEKPRKVHTEYVLTVGVDGRDYDFCSTECLVKALEGQESI